MSYGISKIFILDLLKDDYSKYPKFLDRLSILFSFFFSIDHCLNYVYYNLMTVAMQQY